MKNVLQTSLFTLLLAFFFSANLGSTFAYCYPKTQTAPGAAVPGCSQGGTSCSASSANATMCCTVVNSTVNECQQASPSLQAPAAGGGGAGGGVEDYKVRLCKGDTTGECSGCLSGGGIYTAVGCFSGDAGEFTGKVLKFAVGIAGGVSFLMLVYGAFLYTVSAGDPKALDNAKGTISGALTGLIFIIFSAILLNMIGFQILQIPGF